MNCAHLDSKGLSSLLDMIRGLQEKQIIEMFQTMQLSDDVLYMLVASTEKDLQKSICNFIIDREVSRPEVSPQIEKIKSIEKWYNNVTAHMFDELDIKLLFISLIFGDNETSYVPFKITFIEVSIIRGTPGLTIWALNNFKIPEDILINLLTEWLIRGKITREIIQAKDSRFWLKVILSLKKEHLGIINVILKGLNHAQFDLWLVPYELPESTLQIFFAMHNLFADNVKQMSTNTQFVSYMIDNSIITRHQYLTEEEKVCCLLEMAKVLFYEGHSCEKYVRHIENDLDRKSKKILVNSLCNWLAICSNKILKGKWIYLLCFMGGNTDFIFNFVEISNSFKDIEPLHILIGKYGIPRVPNHILARYPELILNEIIKLFEFPVPMYDKDLEWCLQYISKFNKNIYQIILLNSIKTQKINAINKLLNVDPNIVKDQHLIEVCKNGSQQIVLMFMLIPSIKWPEECIIHSIRSNLVLLLDYLKKRNYNFPMNAKFEARRTSSYKSLEWLENNL